MPLNSDVSHFTSFFRLALTRENWVLKLSTIIEFVLFCVFNIFSMLFMILGKPDVCLELWYFQDELIL